MSKPPAIDDFYGIGIVDSEEKSDFKKPASTEQSRSESKRVVETKEEPLDDAEEFITSEEPESTPEITRRTPGREKQKNAASENRQVVKRKDVSKVASEKAKRQQHFDSSHVAGVERIRALLGDGKLYDPDAQSFDLDEFIDESEWTIDELTAPALRNAQEFLRKRDESAFAAVSQIRKEEKDEKLKHIAEYDRDGSLMSLYRIWSLIPPVYKLSREELAQMLARRVLYNQDDIIAINKPYGISTTRSISEGERIAVSTALSHLRPLIAPKSEKLYVMHRLDKVATGTLLLAGSRLRASELKDMFNQRKIQKKYWVLVRNIPDPEEGIIDIPLIEAKVGGRFKTIPVIRPGQTLEQWGRIPMKHFERGSMEKDTPVTEYKILKTGPKCALVECIAKSGFTHQIRCHMGFGMGTPILGDHKYSDYLHYLPQRLPPDMLQRLQLRSAKSRSMPMHLHAREILIPEYSNGKNLQIKALLPKYFVYVLKKLRIPLT